MATSHYITIWNEVVNILENDTELKKYMTMSKQLFQGAQQDYIKHPVIILEPREEEETIETLGNRVTMIYRIVIYGAVRVATYEKSLVGSGDSRGIMQHAANIKNALGAYPKLAKTGNSLCDSFRFESTRYEVGKFPERDVEIIMNIKRLRSQTGR